MIEFNVALEADDGRMVSMTPLQANTIQTLANTRKAGIASVTGYKPTTDWKVRPTQNIQLITHISIENLYKRKLEALNNIGFNDILPLCLNNPRLAGEISDKVKKGEPEKFLGVKDLHDIFNTRKAQEIASLEKSLASFAGETIETDNHREAHKLCYAHFGNVKVNLEGEGKPKVLTQDTNGVCKLASIMIPYIELNVKTITEGERKAHSDSGSSVLMKNVIQQAVNKKSTVLKTLSLKADNFESFQIDGNKLVAEDVARFGDIVNS